MNEKFQYKTLKQCKIVNGRIIIFHNKRDKYISSKNIIKFKSIYSKFICKNK